MEKQGYRLKKRSVACDREAHRQAYPELPECMRNVERVCVLLETLDKNSANGQLAST